MNAFFKYQYNGFLTVLDAKLREYLLGAPEKLQKSIEYSVFGDGKRLRPVLFLAVLDAYGMPAGDAEYRIAAAIECIHTYSLIHDDLPAMDNDSMRRGKPSNHIIYGEATALLAGDALLNFAFELLLSAVKLNPAYIDAAMKVAACAGVGGMIGGQALEFENDIKNADEKLLLEVYDKKCGKLIAAGILAAALIAGKQSDYTLWEQFAESFGLGFQLADDLIDEDEQTDYGTLLNLWGRAKTGLQCEFYGGRSLNLLSQTTADVEFLRTLVLEMLCRSTDGI